MKKDEMKSIEKENKNKNIEKKLNLHLVLKDIKFKKLLNQDK